MQISVCMIVRNEEKHIQRVLSSIPASYEKIVVDTGSTDRTVEMASSLGAKVSHYTWNHDFAAARNESVAQAAGDYILILDADEELAVDTEKKISEFIFRYPQSAGTVTIHNLMNNEMTKHRMVRFFPNQPSFYFKGTVHEQVYYFDQAAEFKDTKVTVTHFGYGSEQYKEKEKAQRYLELYYNRLEKNPNDGYMLYQLGKLYYSMNDFQQARGIFYQCLQVNEENNLYFPVMIVMLGYALKKSGQSQAAEQLLAPYLTKYPDFPDLPFLLGLLCMDTGNIVNIESYFLAALNIGETHKYSSVEGVGSFKAAYNLGVYYEILGKKSKAVEFYQISASYGYKQAQVRLSESFFGKFHN